MKPGHTAVDWQKKSQLSKKKYAKSTVVCGLLYISGDAGFWNINSSWVSHES